MAAFSLQAHRINSGLTLKEAAQKIGVNPATLFSWEHGVTYPNVPEIEKIEEVYSTEYRFIDFLRNDISVKPKEE